MNVCILIPTAGEARRLIAALKMKQTGGLSFAHEERGMRVDLHLCGIGVDNARRQAKAALDQGTDCLVLAGICGGLQESLSIGDAVIDTQFPDPDFTATVMRIAKVHNIAFHLGAIFTSPRFLAKPEEKAAAGIASAAVAVDMEGDGVLELCQAGNLPFRSFRTVSDDVNQRLPGALKHITLDEKTTWRFWCALGCRIWEWPSVFRMLLSGRLARKNLTMILVDWVHGLPGGFANRDTKTRMTARQDEGDSDSI